jgi:hypothetical protein
MVSIDPLTKVIYYHLDAVFLFFFLFFCVPADLTLGDPELMEPKPHTISSTNNSNNNKSRSKLLSSSNDTCKRKRDLFPVENSNHNFSNNALLVPGSEHEQRTKPPDAPKRFRRYVLYVQIEIKIILFFFS